MIYDTSKIMFGATRCLLRHPRLANLNLNLSEHTRSFPSRRCAKPQAGVHSLQIRNIGSDSAAYEGDGKTTVRVLNAEESHLNLVNTYSAVGFRLHNNLFITGSILLFPTNVFSWNVKRGKDITMDSLMIFDLIVPKTKIVIIGYGQLGEEYDASIPIKLKKKGISCEMLATPNAVTTYNYLVHDSVLVAGAFIPVKTEVVMQRRDTEALIQHDYLYKEMDYGRRQSPSQRESDFAPKEFVQKYSMKDKGKKTFDEK